MPSACSAGSGFANVAGLVHTSLEVLCAVKWASEERAQPRVAAGKDQCGPSARLTRNVRARDGRVAWLAYEAAPLALAPELFPRAPQTRCLPQILVALDGSSPRGD